MENEIIILDKLFEDVKKFIEVYESEVKKTGEGFNLFHILGLTTNEVRSHTTFLCMLLNPDGVHGQGEVFLKIFLRNLEKRFVEDWKLNHFNQNGKAIVKKEKSIGLINQEVNEGGNVDLIITNNKNQAIIIENKINAGDQKNQLYRYYNYGKRFKDGFELLYLTLEGRIACELSKGGILNENDYKRISYSDDILNWLEECIQIVKEKHLLLYTSIAQYIYIIKLLTGKTKYNNMEVEIRNKIIENATSFEIARKIGEQYNKIISDLIPENTQNKINNIWKERFSITGKDLLLFTYKEYEIFASISDENEWHTQIKPLKKLNNNEKLFGVANDNAIGFVRNAIESIDGFNKFKNHNYTIWLYSAYRYKELPTNEYLSLLEETGVSNWANKVVSEAEEILSYFINNILLLPEEILKEIKWNEERGIKIQELIANFKK